MKQTSITPSSIAVYGSAPSYSARKTIGLALTLLVHGLLLWLILFQHSEEKTTNSQGSENPITWMLPNVAPAAKPQPAKAAPPPPKAAAAKKIPKKVITTADAPPIIRPDLVAAEPAPQPAKPEPIQAPAEDMSSMLDAARKRRAEAARAPSEAAEESEGQRADRIARANIARSGSQQGRDQVDAGGVFQVRRVGVSSGEVYFRGWRTDVGRTASQLINVFAAPGEDIQVAIVNRMIEVIRREKPDEFQWDSRRLGQTVTMSARRDQQDRLVTFLLREFFPDYVPSRPR
jgi:hypothetical protein